jgi:hypothetical protein
MQGGPTERAEYVRTVSVNVDGYRIGLKFIHELIARSSRSQRPGGLWLLGDGGLGKSFILEAAYEEYAPHESQTERICPLLAMAFESRPSESDILLSILIQLGQDPDTLRYQSNRELRDIALDGMLASGTLGILFDESHHLWLNTRAHRVADRVGGRLGDFLKTFYDKTGVAFIFSGTPGLQSLYDADGQANTRWGGIYTLKPFADDGKFQGMLNALDQALPLEECSDLAGDLLRPKLYIASRGNFRRLKALLAEAVFLAASEGARRLTIEHLKQAYFLTFCSEETPFGNIACCATA